MNLIEKIDAEIEERQNKAFICAYNMEIEKEKSHNHGEIKGLELAKQIAIAEQKEHDGCKGCLYEDKEEIGYPCSQCKQCYIDHWELKPRMTIGDKIREDNESLSAFIREQFGDGRVFYNGGKAEADLDDFLNQPYTEEAKK